jgi:hypothetical protein
MQGAAKATGIKMLCGLFWQDDLRQILGLTDLHVQNLKSISNRDLGSELRRDDISHSIGFLFKIALRFWVKGILKKSKRVTALKKYEDGCNV